MKRLYIIVEGQTEEEFVKSILLPYLNQFNVFDVRPIPIRTSIGHKGGFVNYQHLKNLAVNLLKEQNDIIITTLVDYFRIPNNIPEYESCMKNGLNTSQRITLLQEAIKNDIQDYRFHPYIQPHEFEAILFSSVKGFNEFFPDVVASITEINQKYTSPEDINDGPDTAPSKRLKQLIRGYDKIIYGNLIILENGIDSILNTCPKFKNWIDILLTLLP